MGSDGLDRCCELVMQLQHKIPVRVNPVGLGRILHPIVSGILRDLGVRLKNDYAA